MEPGQSRRTRAALAVLMLTSILTLGTGGVPVFAVDSPVLEAPPSTNPTEPDPAIDADKDPGRSSLTGSTAVNFFLGAIFGFVLNEIFKTVKRRTHNKYRRTRSSAPLPKSLSTYDPREDGIIQLFEWSPTRPLLTQRLRTVVDLNGPPVSHLLAGPSYDKRVAELTEQGYAGDNVHICSIEPDYRESDRSQYFTVHIARSAYAQAIASQRLLTSHEEVREALSKKSQEGVDAFLPFVPTTSTSVNILVISAEGNTLVTRRSRSVALFAEQWGFGVNESMKFRADSGHIEDFFETVNRGMKEEIGLTQDDYYAPQITSLSYALPAAAFGFTAVIRIKPHWSELAVEESMRKSHSSYEHDALRWVPISRQTVESLMLSNRLPGVEGDWIYFARFSLKELWRFRLP